MTMNNTLSSTLQHSKEAVLSHVDSMKNKGAAMLVALLLATQPIDTDAHVEQLAGDPIVQLKQGLTVEEQKLADHLMSMIPQDYKAIVTETMNEGLKKYGTNPDIRKLLLMCLSNITQHIPGTNHTDTYSRQNVSLLGKNNGQNGMVFNDVLKEYAEKEQVLNAKLDQAYEQELQQNNTELQQSNAEFQQSKIVLENKQKELQQVIKELEELKPEEVEKSFRATLQQVEKQFDRAMKTGNMHVFYNSPNAIKAFIGAYNAAQKGNTPIPHNFLIVMQELKQRNLIK